MNNSVSGKTMENVRRPRNIKLITTEARGNYSLSEPNYHKTKFFSKDLLAIEMKRKQILMNEPVFLGLPILEISKIVMSEFLYDYVKTRIGTKIIRDLHRHCQKMLKQDLIL